MSYKVIIPARYGSHRLPGKPLLDLAGKPMLQRVIEKAQASSTEEILVATDDTRVQSVAAGLGVKACMTSPGHPSGTDRLAEVVVQQNYPDQTVIVNVQGDEPLLPPQLIGQLAEALKVRPEADAATLCVGITDREELFNPHAVKVVRDRQDYALYFSRAPIPWPREESTTEHFTWPAPCLYYRHIGIYAYRAGFLRRYPHLPACPPEKAEHLEQLRILYYGGRIYVPVAHSVPPAGVDTPADLKRVRQLLSPR